MKEKREEVYLAALDRLYKNRRGFDYTQEDVWRSAKLREITEKDNSEYVVLAAKIRLYASERVLELWIRSLQMARFSFSSGQRLFENSKWNFDSE